MKSIPKNGGAGLKLFSLGFGYTNDLQSCMKLINTNNGDHVWQIGVWFMHCHLEIHTSWGLKMAWVVLDGKLPNQKLPPPPADLPKC